MIDRNKDAVLAAVRAHASRPRDIVMVSGVPKGSVTRALRTLEDMGLIRRREDSHGGGIYLPAHSCLDCQLHHDEAKCQVVERTAYDICDQWVEKPELDEDDEDIQVADVADEEAAVANMPAQADELDAYEARVKDLEVWSAKVGLEGAFDILTGVKDHIEGMRQARRDYAEADKAVRVGLAMLEAGRAELEPRTDAEEAMARR